MFISSSNIYFTRLGCLRKDHWILGPKKNEVTGGCRKLHNEELRNMYTSPNIIFSLWLYSPWRTLAASHFLELFRHMVGLLGWVISPSQGLYRHGTTQHRKTRTNIYALNGIRTHDPSNQPAKTHVSDRTATVTGTRYYQDDQIREWDGRDTQHARSERNNTKFWLNRLKWSYH
jgi:hypothetical protein